MKKSIIFLIAIAVIAAIVFTALVMADSGKESGTDSLVYDREETKVNGEVVDVYTNESGDEYKFDGSEQLIGFSASDDALSDEISAFYENRKKGIAGTTEEKAVQIALDIAKKEYPDVADTFVPDGSTLDEGSGITTVRFSQHLGKDGFVKGLRFYASVFSSGKVYAFGLTNAEQVRGFDESALDGITEADIVEKVEKEAVNIFGDRVKECSIREGVSLGKLGDHFVLEVKTYCTFKDEDFPAGFTYRYDPETGSASTEMDFYD